MLVIEVEERNTFVVQNLWVGIAADEDTAGNARPLSAFVGLQVAETNLAGTGITLGAGIAHRRRSARAAHALRRSRRSRGRAGPRPSRCSTTTRATSSATATCSSRRRCIAQREVTDYAVVAYQRFGATLGTGHDLGVASSFALDYHLEQIDATVPTVASHLRGETREPIDFSIRPGKSVLSTAPRRRSRTTRATRRS